MTEREAVRLLVETSQAQEESERLKNRGVDWGKAEGLHSE